MSSDGITQAMACQEMEDEVMPEQRELFDLFKPLRECESYPYPGSKSGLTIYDRLLESR